MNDAADQHNEVNQCRNVSEDDISLSVQHFLENGSIVNDEESWQFMQLAKPLTR